MLIDAESSLRYNGLDGLVLPTASPGQFIFVQMASECRFVILFCEDTGGVDGSCIGVILIFSSHIRSYPTPGVVVFCILHCH